MISALMFEMYYLNTLIKIDIIRLILRNTHNFFVKFFFHPIYVISRKVSNNNL